MDVLLYTTNSVPKRRTLWLSIASADPVQSCRSAQIEEQSLHVFGGRHRERALLTLLLS